MPNPPHDDSVPPDELPETIADAVTRGVDERIGPYRLLDKLGEGGMGEVWLAEQREPVQRKVALKLIKPGMDTRQVVARFEAERQALAMMDHPAIAKVYDAGVTPAGRPYFAMEHVQGIPITRHCDRHKLTNRERLELFVEVCEGVQHAHHKAVIHRDLKPSNVLVAIRDGKPAPKIIDFGVAKAIAHKLTDQTMHTRIGVMIGTPAYMSPEQAELTGQDIDTRTDVYALGVMLYELLVGALPIDLTGSPTGDPALIRQRIREQEPLKPSSRVSLGDHSAQSAERRRTELPTLRRELSGDLDWITLKALEKDRARRYASPMDLAADIDRYLTDRPVSASPPSATYRAGKFVRRNTAGVTMAAAGLLVLVVFAATMAVQAGRIAKERDLARRAQTDLEAVVEFQAGMLASSDPQKMGRRLIENLAERVAETQRELGRSDVQVAASLGALRALVGRLDSTELAVDLVDEEILTAAIDTLEEQFSDRPLIDARLRASIGETYRLLGRFTAAEPQLERAVELRRQLLGDEHHDTVEALGRLAILYEEQARYDEAEPLFVTVLDARKRLLGDDHPDTLGSMNSLALLYKNQGRYDEAEPLFVDARQRATRTLGADHEDTFQITNNLAVLYSSIGRYDEAEPLLIETLEIKRRQLGEYHRSTLLSLNNLAELYRSQGRLDEAEPLLVEAVEAQTRVLGGGHAQTLQSINNLAVLYQNQDRLDLAEPLFVEVLDARQLEFGADHPQTLLALNNLAGLYAEQGHFEKAEPLLLETLAAQERTLGADHFTTVITVHNLANLAFDTGRLNLARQRFERAQRFCDERLEPTHGFALANLTQYAGLLREMGDEEEAERLEARVTDAGRHRPQKR